MKILLITDTHVGVRNDAPTFLDNFKKSCDEFLFPYIKQNNIDHILHLGDLVDRRKYVNINTANRLRVDFLDPLEKIGIPMTIIAGNHDEYYKNTNMVNFLYEFVGKRYSNIEVVADPTEWSFNGDTYLLLPWICDTNYDESVRLIT